MNRGNASANINTRTCTGAVFLLNRTGYICLSVRLQKVLLFSCAYVAPVHTCFSLCLCLSHSCERSYSYACDNEGKNIYLIFRLFFPNTDAHPASCSRHGRKIQQVIYIISGRSNSVERYDQVTCACVPCNQMRLITPGEETRCALLVGQDLHVISTCAVEKFDPLALCWSTVCTGRGVS